MKYTKNEAAKELDRVVTEVLSKTDNVHWLELMEEMTELVRKHAPNKHGLSPVNHVKAMNEKLAELEAKMKQDPYGTIGSLYGGNPGVVFYDDPVEYKTGYSNGSSDSGVGSDDIPF
jgi:hypothetical protein